jgi:AraC family transcriptional regulator of adaptative response / DNA-3-methyladenine glycosylase II
VRSVLAACAVPGVERVDERGYARTIACAGGPAYVFVQPSGVDDTLTLRVRGAAPVALFQLSSTTKRMFDLEADPARIASAFAHDPVLAPLVRRRPGVRIPGAWDAFECAVGTIIDEESTAARRIWLARLVAAAGRPIADGALGLTHLFPSPAAVAAADLAGIGLPPSRVKALRALAHAVLDGLDMNGPAEGVRAALSSVAGVGARTAERVALRALGEPDAFPVDDRALQRAVGAAAPTVMPPSPLEARADSWRPWRGYAAALLGGAPEDVL